MTDEDVGQVLDNLKERNGFVCGRGVVVTVIGVAIAAAVVLGIGRLAAQDDVRVNQCHQIRTDVTERTIILREGQEGPLADYWRDRLLPDLRARYARIGCEGELPMLPGTDSGGR